MTSSAAPPPSCKHWIVPFRFFLNFLPAALMDFINCVLVLFWMENISCSSAEHMLGKECELNCFSQSYLLLILSLIIGVSVPCHHKFQATVGLWVICRCFEFAISCTTVDFAFPQIAVLGLKAFSLIFLSYLKSQAFFQQLSPHACLLLIRLDAKHIAVNTYLYPCLYLSNGPTI